MKYLVLTLFLFIAVTFNCSGAKRIFQVKFAASIKVVGFMYRDADFNNIVQIFSNTAGTDVIVSKELDVAPGTVIKNDITFPNSKNGQLIFIEKSFFVPDGTDTIKFSVDANYDLQIVSGIKFFIQDAVLRLNLNPNAYRNEDKSFIGVTNGRAVIETMYTQNRSKIEEMRQKQLCTERERVQLLTIAKTDYYFRTLYWATTNNGYDEIADAMMQLESDKEELQSVTSNGLNDVFSNYLGYLISKRNLDLKNIRQIVNMIIQMGWNKALTTEYLVFALGDKQMLPSEGLAIYNDVKKYLNGQYDEKLIAISKILVPKLTNLAQISLMDVKGGIVNLKQLIDRNPGKIFLIDFWASWCKPCRVQAPFFERNKQKFAGTNVLFLSISLDEDDKVVEWKNALKVDGLIQTANQFKLLKPTSSSLFKNFKISAIPRYSVINGKGEFIDSDFLMPSDAEFANKLSKLLN